MLAAGAFMGELLEGDGPRDLDHHQPPAPQAGHHLTARQLDVLELVRDGLTDAEIAQRLVLSVKTVNHHVAAILAKLGADNRRDAARRYPAAAGSGGD